MHDLRVPLGYWEAKDTADHGRGALVPRRVTRLYRNTTTEWLRLTWEEDREPKELVTTPGHHFLDRHGRFTRTRRMLEDDRATIVLANGTLTEVRAERIRYSAESAFKRSEPTDSSRGNWTRRWHDGKRNDA